jgi:antirestriction protein ArdC
MSRHGDRARFGSDRTSLYDDITNQIIAQLEAGTFPWVQPWGTAAAKAPLALPKNASTGRRYSGINILVLWGAVIEHGFPSQGWLTFRQAVGLGGHVRKGERGTTVFYADRFVPEDERQRAHETGEEAQAIPFLKRFTVFNVAQCEGLPDDITAVVPPAPVNLIDPRVDTIIKSCGIDFRIGGARAFYMPAEDYVQVPPPQAFFEPVNFHRTALHELVHGSGHASRLNRDLSGSFGSSAYSREELCAELGPPIPAPHSESRRPFDTPIILDPGSRCCARITASSSAQRRRQARPPIIFSPFFRPKMSNQLTSTSTKTGRPRKAFAPDVQGRRPLG